MTIFDLILSPEGRLLILAVALLCVTCYLYGDWRGSRAPVFADASARATDSAVIVDPFPQVPVDVPTIAEVEAITGSMEIVGYLEPVVTLARVTPMFGALAPLEVAPDAAMQALVDERNALLEEVAMLTARLEQEQRFARWKDKLRARYLRLLRVERARVRAVFGEVWQRPRKPSLARLAHEVIDIGTAAHPTTARLVPISIVRELAAAS